MIAFDPQPFDCPHGARCGGCAFLGLPYEAELARKEALVRAAFARYEEHRELAIEPVGPASPTTQYRVRAKLVRDASGALGLYARDSHDVVDIPQCRVLAPELLEVAARARAALGAAPVEALDLRLVDRGILVTLIAPRGTSESELRRVARTLVATAPSVIGVAASFRAADAATVLGTGHVLLFGDEVEPHHLSPAQPYHLAAHGAFVQAHLGQAENAHAAIERALAARSSRKILELYAGSGALALRLSRAGLELTAVEAFEPALAHAERAAREQNLALRALCAPAERATEELARRGEPFDAVIANPPRRGLAPEVRAAIAELAPSTFVYMSCEARTLARDLSHLAELGFTTRSIAPFDMIPHSDAVECLAVAERGPLPPLRIVHQTDTLLVVARSGYVPISEIARRLRALPGAHAAEPLFDVDAAHGGLLPFARTRELRAELRAKLHPTFIGLARGITHKKGRIRRPIARGAPPTTAYERIAVHGGHSLVRIEPHGFDERQIRQHFASIAHPLLGDTRFGDRASNTFFEHRHGLDRIFLQCASLRDTSSGLELELELPGALTSVLASASEQTATRGQ